MTAGPVYYYNEIGRAQRPVFGEVGQFNESANRLKEYYDLNNLWNDIFNVSPIDVY